MGRYNRGPKLVRSPGFVLQPGSYYKEKIQPLGSSMELSTPQGVDPRRKSMRPEAGDSGAVGRGSRGSSPRPRCELPLLRGKTHRARTGFHFASLHIVPKWV